MLCSGQASTISVGFANFNKGLVYCTSPDVDPGLITCHCPALCCLQRQSYIARAIWRDYVQMQLCGIHHGLAHCSVPIPYSSIQLATSATILLIELMEPFNGLYRDQELMVALVKLVEVRVKYGQFEPCWYGHTPVHKYVLLAI